MEAPLRRHMRFVITNAAEAPCPSARSSQRPLRGRVWGRASARDRANQPALDGSMPRDTLYERKHIRAASGDIRLRLTEIEIACEGSGCRLARVTTVMSLVP